MLAVQFTSQLDYMKTTTTSNNMSKTSTTLPQEQLLSSKSTRRQFHSWSRKVRDEQDVQGDQYHHHDHLQQSSNINYSNKENITKTPTPTPEEENHEENHEKKKQDNTSSAAAAAAVPTRKKLPAIAAHVSRIRSVISALNAYKLSHHFPRRPAGSAAAAAIGGGGRLGPKVIGTLFGCRRGNVNFVFQKEHNTSPVFFVELATPITGLVKEMASGLVRIALECDKHTSNNHQEDNNNKAATAAAAAASTKRAWRRRRRSALLDEPIWRTYCNGKKCGFATKRELGPNELKILKTVEPISMGAGVLPGFNGSGMSGTDGELMYMRAKFERVVGSTDSEAFYMMNPDTNGAPELSIYLLRV